MYEQKEFCAEEDQFNNGNGSLMRLAPIPIAFRANEQQAMNISEGSSRTTHNGCEAKECCRLLSYILTSLYKNSNQDPREVLSKACDNFDTECMSVKYLALSME
jgi:ADP-ribosylglycohydrolase